MFFAVVASQRTGSHHLMSLLNSHPQIRADGEILRNGYEGNVKVIEQAFSLATHHDVYGFKMIYKQVNSAIIDYLKPRAKLIHLLRRNRLEQYVSHVLATSSEVWHVRAASLDRDEWLDWYNQPITVDLDQASKYFEKLDNAQVFMASQLGEHLTAYYEDFLVDQSPFFRYLEVADAPLSSVFVRSRQKPLEELITNFEEVKNLYDETAARKGW